MNKVELLAPAKDKQTAIAAINCGADAVYIGAAAFGARKNVPNSLKDIKELVDYAHKFYAKVYATINTILTNDELIQAEKLIKDLYKIGVDAIIIQDFGILELAANGTLPPITIHMSTQCDNRLTEKIKFFEDIGVSRVILARELSLDQINEIMSSTNIEIETFIHGALCVSYSGQCYLSYAIGGRSANRGECAQPCRKKYTLVDETGKIIAKDKHLLNLKDFNASKHIEKLIKAGVKSFKIEGRLKDENYVKNTVSFYRHEIDKFAQKTSSGKVLSDFKPDLNKTFNRGFTDYFLEGRKQCFNFSTPKSIGEKIGKITKTGKNYFEMDSSVKINPQDGLCYFINDELHGFLVNKTEGRKIYPNKMPEIKIGTVIFRNSDYEFEKQLKNSRTKRQIRVDFEIKGGNLIAVDEDKNSVFVKIDSNEVPQNPEKIKETFINQIKKTGESDFYVEHIKINQELPFMSVAKINELRREILELLMNERLKNYKRETQIPLKYVQFPQKSLDYSSNIHNTKALDFYEKCGCEILEKSFESTNNPSKKELMRSKHCLKFAFNMCKSDKKLFLIDEKGKKYQLKFDCKNCEQVLINLS